MAFTFSVTGSVGSQVLTVTSPSAVTISVNGSGQVTLSQGGITEAVGDLTNFGQGGLPVQTLWNGVPAANVVPDYVALSTAAFLANFADGAILEANATGISTDSQWGVLSSDLLPFADESLANLTLTNTQFTNFNASLSNIAALDPIVDGFATVNSGVTGADTAAISASSYQYADFVLAGSTGGANTITGGAGNDTITGGTAADSLIGGAGNDSILGGDSADTLVGGAGADTFNVNSGTDVISDLGNGADILVVANTAGVTATVVSDWTATSASTAIGTSQLTLNVLNGADVNLQSFGNLSSGFTVSASGSSAGSLIVGSALADTITGSSLNDELRGFQGNDSIFGSSGDDAIFGGAGSNTLNGGVGADTFTLSGTDLVQDFGAGADVLVVTSAATASTVTVVSDWTATAASSHTGLNTVTLNLGNGVDVNLRAATGDAGYTINAGGSSAALITGSLFADTIIGSSQNDELRGAAGNDSIAGGSGNDIIYGGAGADILTIDAGTDVVADLGNGADILSVLGTAGVNAIVVSDWTATSASTANGASSLNLTLQSGVDVNLQAFANASSGFTVSAAGNDAASVVVGSSLADTITGSSLNDELRGFQGNDSIFGGSGDDAIFGGAGNNSLVGGAGADTFTVSGTDYVQDFGAGNDVLVATSTSAAATVAVVSDWTATAATSNSSANNVVLNLSAGVDVNLRAATGDEGYTINGGSVAAVITGSNFDDSITGGAGNDQLRGAQGDDIITGGAGLNVVFGGAGADTFNVSGSDTIRDLGFGGDDVLVVGASATVVANVVEDWTATAATSNAGTSATANLYLAEGVDVDLSLATVSGSNGGFTISATNNTEGSYIRGTNVADRINGSVTDDELRGAQGNDTIFGFDGNDVIIGGAGADYLGGGVGSDTFVYATNSTGVTVATADLIEDFSIDDLISTGVAGFTSADVTIADGSTQASFSAFTTAASAAFANGSDVYVAFNQNGSGNALVAINNNGYSGFTTGDSLITLVGINQATDISAMNFIA